MLPAQRSGDTSQRQSGSQRRIGSQRQGRQPDGSGPSGAVDKLSDPAAVAVWIDTGLLGLGLIAGLLFPLA